MTVHDQILLGFEVGSGKPVYMSIHHLAIFGMTQLSGKTTTLEALISRSGLRAIAFKTKRGEGGFTSFHQVTPYYKPRSDWQYVEGLLNTALREKVQYQPFMRWAILQVTKNKPQDLKEVLANAVRCEKEYPRRKEVFEQLAAYLRIVVPELDKHTFSSSLELREGVNVMDVSDMLTETQQLVIASTIEYAFNFLDHVVVIVPEAWESLPQGRMTPIKWVAQQFIRKGAAIGNYLWLDSQDIGGIDKTPLRQCDNWLMGRMKEAHEVERILKQLLGLKVPAEEIQTLPLGHFYAAIGNSVKKVYVLPSDVSEDLGIQVAVGKIHPEQVRELLVGRQSHGDDEEMYQEKCKELTKQVEEISKDSKLLSEEKRKLEEKLKAMEKDAQFGQQFKALLKELMPIPQAALPSDQTQNVEVNLDHKALAINLHDSGSKEFSMTTEKPAGQLLFCALEFQNQGREIYTSAELQKEAIERGWKMGNAQLGGTLLNLVRQGVLIQDGSNYRLPKKVTVHVAKA